MVRALPTWCPTTRHSRRGGTRTRRPAASTDMVGASINVKASNRSLKRLPSRAHGTGICVTFQQPEHVTRGTSTCSYASYWNKSKCRQERASRSWKGCAAAAQPGQTWRMPPNVTCKSIRQPYRLKSARLTCHGAPGQRLGEEHLDHARSPHKQTAAIVALAE